MMGCSRSAAKALQKSDLLIVLGSRLNSMTTGPDFDDFGRNAKVVVVDIDLIEHSKPGRKADLFLEIDLENFLNNVNSTITYQTPKIWIDECEALRQQSSAIEDFMSSVKGVDLYQMANAISNLLPMDGILVTDSGLIELILPTNIKFRADQRCLHPVSQGAMGYALPASIGAHFASKCPITVVTGDGSIMMNLQELQTIKHNNIPVKIIVVNNNAYSIIRKRQSELFRGRTIGTDSSNGLSCPDFEKVANGFGLKYLKADDLTEFELAFNQALAIDGPLLLEVRGLPDQEYIQMGRRVDVHGKLQRMPIENQFPFTEDLTDGSNYVDSESNKVS
jgi:acetolactate synthase-1/2/3 large subunit